MSSSVIQTHELAFNLLPKITSNLLKEKSILDFNQVHSDFIQACNLLCANYIYDFLITPIQHTIHTPISSTSLQTLLRIKPGFEKFYHYMLSVMQEETWLSVENELLQFKPPAQHFSSSIQHYQLLKEKFPNFSGTLDLLHHCASHYSLALAEDIPAISVLYPNGESTFIEKKLAENKVQDTQMPIIRELIIELITQIARAKPLRILEVGGGRGMVTKSLLNKLKEYEVNYHFTDIGRKFILDMTRYAQSEHITFVECFQFDISNPSHDPRLITESYDIILSLDVIHATKNISTSLLHLTPLLKQDGCLCLLETTYVPRWWHLIMGLAKGWWLFDDDWRHNTPLLSLDTWKKVLTLSELPNIHFSVPCQNSDAALILSGKSY